MLLTIGRDLDPAVLGEVPETVHVERWVDQADVLAVADAVISHGGSGTVLGTLAAGLPHVVLPLFADQGTNARRLAGEMAAAPTPDELLDALLAE